MTEEAAKGAAPAGLKTLTEPENQQAMEDLARSKAVRSLGDTLGQGMLQGAASVASATMPADRSRAPATQLATRGTAGPGPMGQPGNEVMPATQASASAAVLNAEPGPSAVQSAIRMAAEEAREAAFGPKAQIQAREWAASVASGTATGTAEATRRELGPAVAAALREEVAPAMREVVRESVQGAMEGAGGQDAATQPSGAAVARSISKGAALGVSDASSASGQGGAMASMQQTANRAIWVLVGLIAVSGILGLANSLGLLVLALTIWRSRPRSAP